MRALMLETHGIVCLTYIDGVRELRLAVACFEEARRILDDEEEERDEYREYKTTSLLSLTATAYCKLLDIDRASAMWQEAIDKASSDEVRAGIHQNWGNFVGLFGGHWEEGHEHWQTSLALYKQKSMLLAEADGEADGAAQRALERIDCNTSIANLMTHMVYYGQIIPQVRRASERACV